MRRTAAIVMLTVFGASAVPAAAAEGNGATSAASATAATATAERTLGADVDWSLTPVKMNAPARGSVLPALYASLAGLQALDAYTTTIGLTRGATEGNVVMSGIAGNSAALWAAKGGATFASIYAAECLWKQHRRAQAIGVMIASNAIMAAVAAHNAALVRQLR